MAVVATGFYVDHKADEKRNAINVQLQLPSPSPSSDDPRIQAMEKYFEHIYRPWSIYTDGMGHYRITDGNGYMYETQYDTLDKAAELIRDTQILTNQAAEINEQQTDLPRKWQRVTRDHQL